ncbi:MAG: ABC transporter permease, partial [Firmicutes bacterium]|nr:ABC transporter permease [Bacillota bacterium]
ATAMGAVLLGVRRVLNITPAMAMKSRAPSVTKQSILPRSWTARLGTFRKLGIRSMTRSPLRGLLIILAVAFPFALSPVLFSFSPIVDEMIDAYFGKVRTYDLQLAMASYSDPNDLGNAGLDLPFVTDAEGICQTPVQLKNDNLKEYSMLYGLQRGSKLWKVGDNEGNTFDPPESGIVLNERLAKKLHLQEGDVVGVNLTAYGNTWVDVPVRMVVTEIFGGSCYMDLGSFPRQLGVGASANMLLLSVQDGHVGDVKAAVRNTSMVPSIIDAEKITSSFAGMMDSMVMMVNMFAFFAVVAGFVLIHNISMINIRERFTELGTLEVLGATKKEIDGMLRDESILYFLGGIALGIPGSIGFKKLIEVLIISESYAIRMHVQPMAYVVSFAMCAGMMWLAWKQDTKLIRTIALTDILKERE